MAIEWLAGNRLRGTTAERPALSLQSPSVGGWVEVGRTTLGSAGDDITVSSLPDKRYYMVLSDLQDNGSSISSQIRLGYSSIDTGSNYSKRTSKAGGTDATLTGQSTIDVNTGYAASEDSFNITYIANKSNKEKLIQNWWTSNATGAGNAPYRIECVAKWSNTSNPLDIFNNHNGEAGSYNTGSEVVVLGWSPDDSHTSNFFEELASVDLSGGSADVLSSGTISAKRYLWVQFYVKKSGSIVPEVSFNDSTANEYAYRFSDNGASDGTLQVNKSAFRTSTDDTNSFVNMFIINNSSNEKIAIVHSSDVTTTGAGAAPSRREIVAKWTGSSQITKIDIDNVSSGNFDTASTMKVWGAD